MVGFSDRQIELRLGCGRWVALHRGVYRVEGAPRTWHQQLKAASLWAARDFAISHRAAAALWGFARFQEGPVELSVTRNLRLHRPAVIHQVTSLPAKDLASIAGLRVTSAARTLLDLSATEDRSGIRASVDEALRRKWTTLDRLETMVQGASHQRGVMVLRELLEHYRGGEAPTESELEALVDELLESEGLPRPTKQARVIVGGKLRRLDFRFPGLPVVIEADGYAYHSSVAAFERDRDRNNALISRGVMVLHWTWAALRDRPHDLIAQLRRTLAQSAAARQG
jgi:very-short-patch-repair endonuclease